MTTSICKQCTKAKAHRTAANKGICCWRERTIVDLQAKIKRLKNDLQISQRKCAMHTYTPSHEYDKDRKIAELTKDLKAAKHTIKSEREHFDKMHESQRDYFNKINGKKNVEIHKLLNDNAILIHKLQTSKSNRRQMKVNHESRIEAFKSSRREMKAKAVKLNENYKIHIAALQSDLDLLL